MYNKASKNHDIIISKILSRLLRHQAINEGLNITREGFILVSELLDHKSLKGKCTVDDIKRIVANNDKQRFTLKTTDRGLELRANQGHSIKSIDNIELQQITNVNQVANVIHGTYFKAWNKIKTDGLSCMNRNHIHFAENLIGNGIRKSAQVYIYINLENALKAGFEFYKSANGVILSPGDVNGYIKPNYFLKVLNARDKTELIY